MKLKLPRYPAQGTDISVVVREANYLSFIKCKKLKLLRYPAQGTGISVVVRETHYFSFNVKISNY